MNVNKLVVAARFNVNARGYRSVLKAVDGLPSKLTDLTKEEEIGRASCRERV